MKGFTLIELLLVMSLLVLMALIIMPTYGTFITSNVLASSKYEVIQNIRLAETKAINSENDSNWGVYFYSTSYTLYKGTSYTIPGRDTSKDQTFQVPINIINTNLTEINFAKKTGLPSSAGSLIMMNIISDKTETININSAGLIY